MTQDRAIQVIDERLIVFCIKALAKYYTMHRKVKNDGSKLGVIEDQILEFEKGRKKQMWMEEEYLCWYS